MTDMVTFTWGLDEGDFSMVREKLNGVRFVKSQGMLRGPINISIPSDYPYEQLEWTSEGLFVVYPYTYSVDTWGVVHLPHRWSHPKDFDFSKPREGVVLYRAGQEYRIKRIPTIELVHPKWGDVWEAREGTEGPIFIKPRPGKPACAKIFRLPVMGSFPDVRKLYSVIWREGVWNVQVQGNVLTLFSKLKGALPQRNPNHSPIVESCIGVPHKYEYTFEGRVVQWHTALTAQQLHKSYVVSSKVLLVSRQGVHSLVGSEAVGGKVRVGETALEAAVREAYEEVHIHVSRADLMYVGLVETVTEEVSYVSYVFLCPVGSNTTLPLLPASAPYWSALHGETSPVSLYAMWAYEKGVVLHNPEDWGGEIKSDHFSDRWWELHKAREKEEVSWLVNLVSREPGQTTSALVSRFKNHFLSSQTFVRPSQQAVDLLHKWSFEERSIGVATPKFGWYALIELSALKDFIKKCSKFKRVSMAMLPWADSDKLRSVLKVWGVRFVFEKGEEFMDMSSLH